MTIEEAIKKSGTTNILAKGSIKKTQSIIGENEEVLYAINTNVTVIDNKRTLMNNIKGVFSFKNSLNGVVAVTNLRVIFCSSIIGNTNIKQILIKDIKSIDESINGLTKMGQFRVQGITESFLINIYKSRISNELREVLYRTQVNAKVSELNSPSNYQLSNADEILKLKQLLDKGIITQEEFDYQKPKLLK